MTVPPSVSQEIQRRSESRQLRGGTIVVVSMILRSRAATRSSPSQHTAYPCEIFAKGAVEAAKFLAGKPAGLIDMADVVG